MPKNVLPSQFITSAKRCGLHASLMKQAGIPHLYVESNKILSSQEVPDLLFQARSFKNGVKIKMVVKKGAKIEKPIFFCFGILKKQGKQIILPEIILEEGAEARIFAHCSFPQAKNIFHQMEAEIKLKEKAKLVYQEKHYHGENFGAEVLPNFKISMGPNTSLKNEFILDQGSIGELRIDLEAKLEKNAFVEIMTKIIGKGRKDKVEIFDQVFLNCENSRSLIKLRGAVVNGGKMFFKGKTEAKARNACGHIDCQEIIIGKDSLAEAEPIIKVNHEEARVTHEASIGKVNQKELETLMTRGLSEKKAIDFIIRGAIK